MLCDLLHSQCEDGADVVVAVDDNVTVLDDVAAEVVAYAADPLGIAVGVDLDEAFVKPYDDEERTKGLAFHRKQDGNFIRNVGNMT